ncbi:MAG: hypothetical protein SPI25_03125 [Dialister sp.]|nr:hypothetical protein [Dialister sp.]
MSVLYRCLTLSIRAFLLADGLRRAKLTHVKEGGYEKILSWQAAPILFYGRLAKNISALTAEPLILSMLTYARWLCTRLTYSF